MHASHDFRERGFARAVLANKRMDLAWHEIEIDIDKHFDAAKLLGNAAGRQKRLAVHFRIGHPRSPYAPMGTGESSSMRFRSLRSDQKAAGIAASREAMFSITSLARAAPGMIETTAGW